MKPYVKEGWVMDKINFKIWNKKILSLIMAGLFTLMPIAKGKSERF